MQNRIGLGGYIIFEIFGDYSVFDLTNIYVNIETTIAPPNMAARAMVGGNMLYAAIAISVPAINARGISTEFFTRVC